MFRFMINLIMHDVIYSGVEYENSNIVRQIYQLARVDKHSKHDIISSLIAIPTRHYHFRASHGHINN